MAPGPRRRGVSPARRLSRYAYRESRETLITLMLLTPMLLTPMLLTLMLLTLPETQLAAATAVCFCPSPCCWPQLPVRSVAT